MRIVSLRAENVKRLRAVEIRPDGNTVVVAGRNAQGKSSVLDAERAALELELSDASRVAARSTRELAEIDAYKAGAIASAAMPIEGLSFDDAGVLYRGVPFAQASAAERLRVGIAMAMALNPTIRVIRITDGSLLDSENLALIDEMAGEHDFQVWVERVDETGRVGITIEDGAVVGGAS